MARALGVAIDADLGPKLRSELVKAVQESLGAALTHENWEDARRNATAIAESVTEVTVKTLMIGLGSGLETEIVPAIRTALEQELGPGFAKVVDEDLRLALSRTTREMTREALLGIDDALKGDLGDTLRNAQAAFWQRLRDTLQEGKEKADSWARVLTLALVLAAAGLVYLGFLWRRARQKALKNDGTVTLVTQAIFETSTEHFDYVDSLLARIKRLGDSPANREGFNNLREFLSEHKELKVKRTSLTGG
jgi:hypothetical protein